MHYVRSDVDATMQVAHDLGGFGRLETSAAQRRDDLIVSA
jgi:hypothetical protein